MTSAPRAAVGILFCVPGPWPSRFDQSKFSVHQQILARRGVPARRLDDSPAHDRYVVCACDVLLQYCSLRRYCRPVAALNRMACVQQVIPAAPIMKRSPEKQPHEVLAGLVERVTYHNAENGFCVLRAKTRGHRDVVTVVGHAATIAAGEWINQYRAFTAAPIVGANRSGIRRAWRSFQAAIRRSAVACLAAASCSAAWRRSSSILRRLKPTAESSPNDRWSQSGSPQPLHAHCQRIVAILNRTARWATHDAHPAMSDAIAT